MNTNWMRPELNMKRDLVDLTACLPSNLKMIEIGSYAGESTELFYQSNKIVECYCIDPWQNNYDNLDDASYIRSMDIVEKAFNERIKTFKNLHKLKMTSLEAVKQFEDKSIDFVYIDGMHTYEAVKQDIKLWKPKIKLNGFIGGHDYYLDSVKRAVHEELGFPDQLFCGSSWLKRNELITFQIKEQNEIQRQIL